MGGRGDVMLGRVSVLADYRCFARLLALRLGRALAPVIDPQQTAFLPGRSIGENLLLLQLLPHALSAEQRSALAVFSDVMKAYDIVDRAFLWKVMGRLGVGGPFLQAARALLSHTWARSCVRGAMSRSVSFSAGVRQGCPLAPLLYLFVGQALGRFLATVGVGITLQGAWLACSQYADDVTAFLPSEAALPAFLQAMQVFGNASGQRLHPGKSQAMLLGNRTLPPIGPQAPIRLVRTAEALGVTFHEGVGTPTVDWQAQVAAVLHRFDRLAALPLSGARLGQRSLWSQPPPVLRRVCWHAASNGACQGHQGSCRPRGLRPLAWAGSRSPLPWRGCSSALGKPGGWRLRYAARD